MIKVFLDDTRKAPNGWIRFENYKNLISFLKENFVNITEISLDHDLGEVKTGYDVCKYIVEHELWIPIINIHSANPVGSFNMYQLLDRYAPKNVLISKKPFKNLQIY